MNYFITFCGGEKNYYDAANRLIEQAQNINLFDKIILYTEQNLKDDECFWEKHSNFIENNKMGGTFSATEYIK